jgi:hypothetical protein
MRNRAGTGCQQFEGGGEASGYSYNRPSDEAGCVGQTGILTSGVRKYISTKDPQFVLSIIPGKEVIQCNNRECR